MNLTEKTQGRGAVRTQARGFLENRATGPVQDLRVFEGAIASALLPIEPGG